MRLTPCRPHRLLGDQDMPEHWLSGMARTFGLEKTGQAKHHRRQSGHWLKLARSAAHRRVENLGLDDPDVPAQFLAAACSLRQPVRRQEPRGNCDAKLPAEPGLWPGYSWMVSMNAMVRKIVEPPGKHDCPGVTEQEIKRYSRT